MVEQRFPIQTKSRKTRVSSKFTAEDLIGVPETKLKAVVVMKRKSVVSSQYDMFTSSQRKVVMKDMLSVLLRDPRFKKRPLVYQLLNNQI